MQMRGFNIFKGKEIEEPASKENIKKRDSLKKKHKSVKLTFIIDELQQADEGRMTKN